VTLDYFTGSQDVVGSYPLFSKLQQGFDL